MITAGLSGVVAAICPGCTNRTLLVDVLPVPARDSHHPRPRVWAGSCFTALRQDISPGLTCAPRGVLRLRPSGGDDPASFAQHIPGRVVVPVMFSATDAFPHADLQR